MAFGCEGCFSSQRGIDERLSALRAEAKKLAIQKDKAIAIVQDGQEYHLCDAMTAVQSNYLIKEIVSA